MRSGWYRWLGLVGLSAVLAGLSMWSWIRGSIARLGLLWTVIPGCLAVLAPMLAWVFQSRATAGAANVDLISHAMAELAAASASRWRVQEATRGALAPWPLPVRWATTDRARAVMVRWSAISGPRQGEAAIDLSGQYTEVADMFTRLGSPRRLVILGEPGAGKTTLAMRLVLDLLDRRCAEDPVPVLLSIGSWNPTRQHIRGWIAAQLAAEFDPLRRITAAPDGRRTSVAARLVDEGRVVPVLDGLDELPATSQGPALAAIGGALRRHDQIVITCRTGAYEQAVAVEGPLASVPVVWLARTIYRTPTSDPIELLRGECRHDRSTIEAHLLDGLVPAVYHKTPPPDAHRPRWSPRQADRWLRSLAQLMTIQNTYTHTWSGVTRAVFGRWVDVYTALVLISALALLFVAGYRTGLGNSAQGVLISALAMIILLGPMVGSLSPLGAWYLGERRIQVHRTAAFIQGGVVAMLIGVGAQAKPISGHAYSIYDGLRQGVVPGLAAGLAWMIIFTTWGRATTARSILALLGRIPWRMAAFLEDAYRRGVLRRVGPDYQFRHARLQERLALKGDAASAGHRMPRVAGTAGS